MEEIKATLISSICDKEGFHVSRFIEVESGKEFIAKGSMLPTAIGLNAVLYGNYVKHSTYGLQLQVNSFDEILPDDPEKIVNYLVFAKIDGLGRATARKIVNIYKEKTYEALEDEKKIRCIRGISEKKARHIVEEYKSKKGMRKIFELLETYNIPSSKASKIQTKFEKINNGIEILSQRPYLLCACEGIEFAMIDDVEKKKPDFNMFNADRFRYAIFSVIMQSERDGNVFTNKDFLQYEASRILGAGLYCDYNMISAYVKQIINELCQMKKLTFEYGVIYRTAMHEAEQYIADKILDMMFAKKEDIKDEKEIEKIIENIENMQGFTLGEAQKNGIIQAINHNVYIITGGPGCGKTTNLNALLKTEETLHPEEKIILCAPTGRAARKMAENTGKPASTIHSLLGLHHDELDIGTLPDIDADVIVVDEFSMVSLALMATLLSCLNVGTKLILVGDVDQLPSVQAGAVFKELIQSGVIPMTVLNQVFRQAEGSSIIENSKKINTNNLPLVLDESSQFFAERNEDMVLKKIKDLLWNIPDKSHVQILTPLRWKTKLGVIELNKELQDDFNPPAPDKIEIFNRGRILRMGDKVIHLKNEPEIELNNGDVGYIERINPQDKSVFVVFETGKSKLYDNSELDQLEHAFVLTIHKSQGSEYEHVILPFLPTFGRMRVRNLLYTAVTRAKNNISIVGDSNSIYYAAANEGKMRNTYLAYRIWEMYQMKIGVRPMKKRADCKQLSFLNVA